MDRENKWDKIDQDADTVQRQIQILITENKMEACRSMIIAEASGPFELRAEMIIYAQVRIGVLMEHYHRIPDGKGMPETELGWLQILFIRKGDIVNCGM